MLRKNVYFVLAVFILMSICGCTSVPTRRVTESGEVITVEKPLGVAAILRFEDVPVPAGFAIVRDQSFIFQDASIRVGLLRYTGRANTSQIISFFKSQMPLYNWNLMNMVEFGNINMNFVKAEETCIVTVESLATRNLVNIVISPKMGTLTTGFGSGSRRKSP